MNYTCSGCQYGQLDGGEMNCPICGHLVEDDIAAQKAGNTQNSFSIPSDGPERLSDETVVERATPVPESAPAPVSAAAPEAATAPPADTGPEGEIPRTDLAAPQQVITPPPQITVSATLTGRNRPPTDQCSLCGCPSTTRTCDVCASLPEPALVLQVEGHDAVIYRGRKVFRVAVVSDVVSVGRRDPATHTYPDIDLREFHAAKVGFTSRKQAEIVYDRGKYYIVDNSGRETTHFAADAQAAWEPVLLNEKRELVVGSRVMFADAVALFVLDLQNL